MRLRELQILTEAIVSFEDWVERERSAKRLSKPDRIQHIKDWMNAKNISIQALQNYTFDRALQKSEEWSDMLQSQSARKKFTEKQGDRTIEYEDNEWLILSPKTPDAACRYSAGTKWCTSDADTAIDYMKKGPLYIAISKTKTKPHPKVEGEMIPVKYQLHIESNQYMDDEDEPIKYMPVTIRKFLVGKGALKLMTEKEINSYMSKRRVWKGDLNLEDTPITQLPDGLKVGGDLYLTETRITQLPDGLKVGRHLALRSTRITQLPDGLKVGGYLELTNTRITQLPDDLEVGGYLDLEGTQIIQLPDGLEVGGSLYLQNTPITQLPDGLKVGGSLFLQNTPITQLPDGLKVGEHLDLQNTPITQLSDGLEVGGSLDLENTPITQLPDGLKVGGSLYLTGTRITQLPDDLEVGGRIIYR